MQGVRPSIPALQDYLGIPVALQGSGVVNSEKRG